MTVSIDSTVPAVVDEGGAFARLWQVLRSPLLLIVLGLLLLVLVGTGMRLPQMPEALDQDPTEAARWLLDAQGRYGRAGALLAGLGLFDLVDSPVVRALLTLLTLLLLLQFGDLLVLRQRYHYLPGLLTAAGVVGEPLSIPGTLPILRQRSGHPVPPQELKNQIGAWTQSLGRTGDPGAGRPAPFRTDIFQADAPVLSPNANPSEDAALQDADEDAAPPAAARVEGTSESRWLIRRHGWTIGARLAGVAGMLLTLAVGWLGIAVGWQSQVPDLSPASRYQDAFHDLQIGYELASGGAESGALTQPQLTVQLGSLQRILAVPTQRSVRLGGAQIRVLAQQPALLVESLSGPPDSAPEVDHGPLEEAISGLALPGGVSTERLSFVFPSVGSEESVLVPAAGVGLRLVRLEVDRFLVEVISGEVGQPVERVEMGTDETRLFELPVAEQNEIETIWVRLRFAPSLSVSVRYLPGDWLLIPALALLLLGVASFLRRPQFLLVQVAPWPRAKRSVTILQSDRPSLIADLHDRLAQLDAALAAKGEGADEAGTPRLDKQTRKGADR